MKPGTAKNGILFSPKSKQAITLGYRFGNLENGKEATCYRIQLMGNVQKRGVYRESVGPCQGGRVLKDKDLWGDLC